MYTLVLGIFARILSNSYLNVFQKLLTKNGEYSSVVNFYTYLGLTLIGLLVCQNPYFELSFLPYILTMGILGALGNFFIIKALSCGELSAIAPINSYKPLIALFLGIILLKEYPGLYELFGISLILIGTIILAKSKLFFTKATLYRIIALILLGTEAIFIKKVILLTDINSAFLYWVITGLFFSIIFVFGTGHSIKIKRSNIKFQLALILLVFIMQYTTNYIFSRMNVAYALALFQLSTLVSLFLGVNIFKENELMRKLIASVIMIIGAIFIIIKEF